MREGRIRAPYSPNLTSHIGKWRSHTIREWTSQSHDSSYRIWWLVYSLHTILENPTTREDDEEEAKTWRKKRTKLQLLKTILLYENAKNQRRRKEWKWSDDVFRWVSESKRERLEGREVRDWSTKKEWVRFCMMISDDLLRLWTKMAIEKKEEESRAVSIPIPKESWFWFLDSFQQYIRNWNRKGIVFRFTIPHFTNRQNGFWGVDTALEERSERVSVENNCDLGLVTTMQNHASGGRGQSAATQTKRLNVEASRVGRRLRPLLKVCTYTVLFKLYRHETNKKMPRFYQDLRM